ncbi:glycosyltransferase family 4 protein [Nonomuraea purpurea]|uniref:Glycosyltransferase family 4 protein n=1 Tax=Nonomuraea purpurea TaxID=1849276 RepID=A0ABV8GT68_9ACTN
MRICAIVKYPPIQGGVSAMGYWTVRGMAEAGHQITVVTNAEAVESDYRIWIPPGDRAMLQGDFPGGGKVRLTTTAARTPAHIPHSPLYVTKLAARAAEAIRRDHCEIIYSHYLEPYGMAAFLASQWTGVPYVLRMAGSDRTRLLADPELSTAYREILRAADAVAASPESIQGFEARAEPIPYPPGRFVPACWRAAEPLDVDAFLADPHVHDHPWTTNRAPLPADAPVIAVYGKLGEFKGSFDLLRALRRLHDGGRRFSLLVLGGGRDRQAFNEAVRESGLASVTWTLPFLPSWRVPELLRRADAVCVLEREFPVAIHTPSQPTEVLAAGRCPVVSAEIAGKQSPENALRDGVNALVVRDPRDTDCLSGVLSRVIDDPETTRKIGARAALDVVTFDEQQLGEATVSMLERTLSTHRDGLSPRPRLEQTGLLGRQMPAATTLAGLPAPAELSHPADIYRAAWELVTRIDSRHEDLPEGAAEIARYELDRLWLCLDLELDDGQAVFPSPDPALPLADIVPQRSVWARSRRYRTDITAAAQALADGREAAPHPGTQQRLLFCKLPSLFGRIVKINDRTHRLIELCDGRNSLRAIATMLRADLDEVTRAARTLARLRVIHE